MKQLTTAHIERHIAELENRGVLDMDNQHHYDIECRERYGFLRGLLASLKPMEELAAEYDERWWAQAIRQRIHDTIEKHGGGGE